jgi:hypothetical protein
MTRRHRQWHLALWSVIGPLALVGLVAGIVLRPGPAVETKVPPRPTESTRNYPRDMEPLR